MFIFQHDLMFFSDTTVNIDPDEDVLAEIALLSASFVRRLGVDPRMAMLSYSNFGSVRNPDTERIRRAVEKVKSLDRKSTRLNSSHVAISYAVFCLKKKKKKNRTVI